jgi:hypothetical protein
MAYEPKLPDGVSLPPGLRVDTSDARYRALEALATRESWSQAAFSETLGIEAAASRPSTSGPTLRPGPSASSRCEARLQQTILA